MPDIFARVAGLNTHLNGLTSQQKAVELQLTGARTTMQTLETEKAHLVKCIAVTDKVIEQVAANGVGRVEQVVTQGLQLVFGPAIACVLEKRVMAKGTTYAVKIKVETENGSVVDDPMEAFGGGPVNMIAFLMRMLMIHRFKLAKFMVLDESFNNVSAKYLPEVSALLRSMTDEHGYDILAITHQPALASAADRTYLVGGVIGSPTLKLLTVGDEA